MALEETVELYETLLANNQDKIARCDVRYLEVKDGQATACVSVELKPEVVLLPSVPAEQPKKGKKAEAEEKAEETVQPPAPRTYPWGRQTIAAATHTNPATAVLIAKALALAEVLNEPTMPLYSESQELKVVAPAVAAPAAGAASAAAAPAGGSGETYKGVLIYAPDGKVRCQENVNGKPCGYEIQAFNGKSHEDLAKSRIDRFGAVLCPKHVALRKK